MVPSDRAAGCRFQTEVSDRPPTASASSVGRVRVRDGVVFKELDGESVLLDLGAGTYFGLNDTGTCLWQGLTESQDLDAALFRLLERFDVDLATARDDAMKLIARLVEKRLLESVEDPASR